MKATLIILSIIFGLLSENKSIEIETVRKNYSSAAANELVCDAMIIELKKNKNSTVLLGYLGGFQTVWANHVFNPVSKLNTFNEGKRNIEKAIKSDPNSLELRFVRLSVQKNAPSFLGYSSEIEEDERFIKKYKNTIHSTELLKMVNALLNE